MSDILKAIDAFVTGNEVDEDSEDYTGEEGWGYELPSRLAEKRREYVRDADGNIDWKKKAKVVPNDPVILPGYGRLLYVEGYEGGEGGGEDAYQVLKLVAEDGSERFFRKEGFYASHYGCDWDGDLYEVKPGTKVIYEDRV